MFPGFQVLRDPGTQVTGYPGSQVSNIPPSQLFCVSCFMAITLVVVAVYIFSGPDFLWNVNGSGPLVSLNVLPHCVPVLGMSQVRDLLVPGVC